MRIILNHRTLEAALPDLAGRAIAFVITPRVCDSKGLEDSADRLSGFRTKEKMEVIGHEAIAEQSKGIVLAGLGERVKEHEAIGIIAKDIVAVISAVEHFAPTSLMRVIWQE